MKAFLLAASLSTAVIVAPAWAQSPNNSHALTGQDKAFIDKAEDGSLAEATLGRLAQQKAADPAVREFGRWMATDHTFANKRLVKIATDAGYDHQPKLTEKDEQLNRQLQGLSGSRFDQQYLKNMVQDHKKTISLFETEAQAGKDEQVKDYAKNLLPVLQQHLAEAEELGGASGAGLSGSSTPSTR